MQSDVSLLLTAMRHHDTSPRKRTVRETPAFSRHFVRDHRPMIGTLGSDFEAFRGIEQ
jgi:hypothetical protein